MAGCRHSRWRVVTGIAGLLLASPLPATAQDVATYIVEGGAIAAPLNGLTGEASRGRRIVTDRRKGLCLLCHSGPFPEERFQGTLAPSLAGAGSRLTEGQLRLRIVDSARLTPGSLMPAFHRVTGLARVGPAWQGKPILRAGEVEDVVAFLKTLRE
jgi:L-cysteine S-thiosulfotransferase